MTPDSPRDEPADDARREPGRDDDLDAAWAQIVAGYGPEPDAASHIDSAVAGPGVPADTSDSQRPDSQPPGSQPLDSQPLDSQPPDPLLPDTLLPDDEGHYVPPQPPPLPRPVGAVGAAWVAMLAGPMALLVATVLGWELPAVVTGLCVLGFVGGLVYLIAQLDNGGRDGWDDGAQL